MMKEVVVIAVTAFLPTAGFAQSSSAVTPGAFHFSGPDPYPILADTGAPYCADAIYERTETLSDGTRSRKSVRSSHECRDSAGRIWEDNPFTSDVGASSPLIVSIFDPVAGYQYILDLAGKVAHRMALTPPGMRPSVSRNPAGASSAGSLAPRHSREWLGTQVMDGIQVEGRRDTMTVPAGAHPFGDRPLILTTEAWISKDLRVTLLTKSSHPHAGEIVTRLTRLTRGDPPPVLFQMPPGFAVLDETGPFTVNLSGR